MKLIVGILIWLSATLFLSGCATQMSKSDCAEADWLMIGNEDGFQGKRLTRLDERIARCESFGIGVDAPTYRSGRSAALEAICTPSGGADFARRGNVYRTVCPAFTEADFLTRYMPERQIYLAEAALERVLNQYDQAVSALEYERDSIRRARRRLADEEATECLTSAPMSQNLG